MGTEADRQARLKEALILQMEMQKRLHDQLEVCHLPMLDMPLRAITQCPPLLGEPSPVVQGDGFTGQNSAGRIGQLVMAGI